VSVYLPTYLPTYLASYLTHIFILRYVVVVVPLDVSRSLYLFVVYIARWYLEKKESKQAATHQPNSTQPNRNSTKYCNKNNNNNNNDDDDGG
jgi:hypothetical protein